jgi:uncharacterized RDD family membrane protein YckC
MSRSSFAPYSKRVLASFIDGVLSFSVQLLGSVAGHILFTFLATQNGYAIEKVNAVSTAGQLLGLFFWQTSFEIVNRWVLQGLTGGTVGKHFCGIVVVNEAHQFIGIRGSIFRNIASLASALPFYIGYLAPLWNRKHQTFHDSICGTIVINKARSQNVIALPLPSDILSTGPQDEEKLEKKAA